jgi:hypothetical protein
MERSMVDRLEQLRDASLKELKLQPGQVDKVVRRVVDGSPVAPKLDVSAFNSSI